MDSLRSCSLSCLCLGTGATQFFLPVWTQAKSLGTTLHVEHVRVHVITFEMCPHGIHALNIPQIQLDPGRTKFFPQVLVLFMVLELCGQLLKRVS